MQREPTLRPTLPQVLSELVGMHQAWLEGWDGLEVGVTLGELPLDLRDWMHIVGQ